MRQGIFISCLLLFSLQSRSQYIQKKTVYVSGAIGVLKPSTYSGDYGDYNKHPFMANIKVGKFVTRGLATGIEFQSTTYTEPESGVGSLQPPGGSLTQKGIITDRFTSIGVYGDFYSQLSKKFFLIPGIYIHYLHEKYQDKGDYYSNGVYAGISYIKSRDLGYFARAGVNITLCYFLKPHFSLSLRCAEFDLRLRRKANDTFIAAPLMAGVQYYFKPKK
jgi:hypothetical protein